MEVLSDDDLFKYVAPQGRIYAGGGMLDKYDAALRSGHVPALFTTSVVDLHGAPYVISGKIIAKRPSALNPGHLCNFVRRTSDVLSSSEPRSPHDRPSRLPLQV